MKGVTMLLISFNGGFICSSIEETINALKNGEYDDNHYIFVFVR